MAKKTLKEKLQETKDWISQHPIETLTIGLTIVPNLLAGGIYVGKKGLQKYNSATTLPISITKHNTQEERTVSTYMNVRTKVMRNGQKSAFLKDVSDGMDPFIAMDRNKIRLK